MAQESCWSSLLVQGGVDRLPPLQSSGHRTAPSSTRSSIAGGLDRPRHADFFPSQTWQSHPKRHSHTWQSRAPQDSGKILSERRQSSLGTSRGVSRDTASTFHSFLSSKFDVLLEQIYCEHQACLSRAVGNASGEDVDVRPSAFGGLDETQWLRSRGPTTPSMSGVVHEVPQLLADAANTDTDAAKPAGAEEFGSLDETKSLRVQGPAGEMSGGVLEVPPEVPQILATASTQQETGTAAPAADEADESAEAPRLGSEVMAAGQQAGNSNSNCVDSAGAIAQPTGEAQAHPAGVSDEKDQKKFEDGIRDQPRKSGVRFCNRISEVSHFSGDPSTEHDEDFQTQTSGPLDSSASGVSFGHVRSDASMVFQMHQLKSNMKQGRSGLAVTGSVASMHESCAAFKLWDAWTSKTTQFKHKTIKKGQSQLATLAARSNSDSSSLMAERLGSVDEMDDSDSEDSDEVIEKHPEYSHSIGGKRKNGDRLHKAIRSCQHNFNRLRCITLSPLSGKRVLWDILCWITVSYEGVSIPLMVFSLSETPFMIFANHWSRMFWSFDLPLSFFTGYVCNGQLQMTPAKVAVNYLKTWFGVDLLLISLDWADFLSGGLGEAASLGRMVKVFRLLRLVKLLRVAKTVRLHASFAKVIGYIFKSEVVDFVLTTIKIMAFLLAINHWICCGWYGLGSTGQRETWILESGLQDSDVLYKYLTSYHWAITQFIGSMSSEPQNSRERAYAISISYLAFLISACVVSSLTSSMTRLEIVLSQRSTELAKLKQFLVDNHISNFVAQRVQRNAVHALHEQRVHSRLEQIELLQVVPEPVRMELQFEIHMPGLTPNLFLQRFGEEYRYTMQQVCHRAVQRTLWARGDCVFRKDEVPNTPAMFVALTGRTIYIDGVSLICRPHAKQSMCEPCLWTPWFHRGTLIAKTDCSFLALDAINFQSIVANSGPDEMRCARIYGQLYVENLNLRAQSRDEIYDIEDPSMSELLLEWLDQAIPRHGTYGSHSVHMPRMAQMIRGLSRGATFNRLSNLSHRLSRGPTLTRLSKLSEKP